MTVENEAPEVTFVGGKAVEQTESLDSNLETDEREAAKEAVRKAIREAEGKAPKERSEPKEDKAPPKRAPKEDKEEASKAKKAEPKEEREESSSGRGPDGRFLPKSGEPKPKDEAKAEKAEPVEEKPFDPDKASLKEILRNRDQVAAAKRQQQETSQAARERAELERQRQEFQQQQYAFQQEQARLRREAEALRNIRQDPARAVREAGLDPEQFIMELANENTPEGRYQRQIREMQQQIAAMNQWRQQEQKAAQERQAAWERQQVQQRRQGVVNEFLTLAKNEEKYPHVSAFYKDADNALVAYGDIVNNEYLAITGKHAPSLADILDHIEDQLAERAKNWYSKVTAAKKQPAAVEEEKPKSKGKSLSPDTSGERRALKPKRPVDEDDADRLERAKQDVAVALANSQ